MHIGLAKLGLATAFFFIGVQAQEPERMAFILVAKRGDSLVVVDVTVVPGHAPVPRRPDLIEPSGKWLCEVRDRGGKISWSGALANPFHRPRHHEAGMEIREDSLAVVRMPYRKGFLRAEFRPDRIRNPEAATAEVPVLTVDLPAPSGEN
jgi:hypothetical protein